MQKTLFAIIVVFLVGFLTPNQSPVLAKCIPAAGEDTLMTQGVLKSMSPELRKKKLVYSDPGYSCNQLYGLYSANSDGSNQRIIFASEQASAKDPAWSPDGKRMVVVKADSVIDILNADGTESMEVTSIDATTGSLYLPVWSKDGKQIAFIRSPYGQTKLATFVINADGTQQFELPNSSELYINVLSWSPDSSRIVYTEKTADGDYEIYLMQRDGSDRSKLADGTQADWSPDGKKIAFATNTWTLTESHVPQLHSAIMVIAPDGSGTKELFVAPPEQYVYDPVWSPKGTYIAFGVAPLTSNDIQINRDIYIINADGSNPRSINSNLQAITPKVQNIGNPSWSFDEQFIAYGLSREDGFYGTTDIGLSEISTGKSTVLFQSAEGASWQP